MSKISVILFLCLLLNCLVGTSVKGASTPDIPVVGMAADTLNVGVSLTIIDEYGREQVIETTDSHPFWVVTDEPELSRAARSVVDENGVILYHENLESGLNGYWVEAKDLRVGDVFLGANGELSTLTNIVRVEQSGGIDVFNFTVEGNHNYFILAKEYEFGQTCILVHNAKACTHQEGDIITYGEWQSFSNKGDLVGHHPVAQTVLVREGYDPKNSPVLIMHRDNHAKTINYKNRNSHSKWSLDEAIEKGLNDKIVVEVTGKKHQELKDAILKYLGK